jgi:hypothetical protein
VMTETIQEATDVLLGMLLNNSTCMNLIESRASHSLITNLFVGKHNIPKHP